MSERKRRDEKDRHELAWNPDLGWQVLRRCPNYQRAVETFLIEAERASDQVSLDAYKIVSLDEAKVPNKWQWPPRRQPFIRAWRGSKKRKELLRDQDLIFKFPQVPTFRPKGYGDEVKKPRYLKVDTNTKHYEKFYKWYGDLLLFPINPNSTQPRIEGLSSLWALYSVKIYDSESASELPLNIKHDKILTFSMTINTSFSKTMIEDDLRWFLRSKLDGYGTIKEKPRWTEEQFEGYLRVMDAVYFNGKRIKITHRLLGEKCAPNSVLNKVNCERAVIDWAKDTLRYVEKKLMPIFDRVEPKKRPKNRY